MLNGHDSLPEDQIPLAAVQERLGKACMNLPLNSQNVGISAFVNVTLLSAQVSALVEYVQPFELNEQGEPIPRPPYQEILLKHLISRAELLERSAPKKSLIEDPFGRTLVAN